MVEDVKMTGDSLQVRFDETGDHFILLWKDKWGRIHITGPGTFHSGDLVVLNCPPMPGTVKPTSPPEMPAVDPSPDFPEAPFIHGKCVRFHQLAGKKKAGTCVGCTVGCKGKGKQEPTKCPTCEGEKQLKDGAGPTDWVTCPDCHGTGEAQKS